MNDKTIQSIYFGDQCPADSRFNQNSEYEQKLKEQQELYAKVEAAFPETTRELLRNLLQADSELAAISSLDAFIKGFRLGMQLTVEGLYY